MRTIVLSAINAEHFPWNFLAALGIQHVLARTTGQPIKLHWMADPVWTAVVSDVDSLESVLTGLQSGARQVSSDPIWTGVAQSPMGEPQKGITQFLVEDYRAMIRPIAWDAETWRWMGLVTEWPSKKVKPAKKDRKGGAQGSAVPSATSANSPDQWCVTPTHLHMLSGGQTGVFLEFIREAAAIAATKPGAIEEALWGPWRYEDTPATKGKGWDETTLGWDATIPHGWAFTDRQPEKMRKYTVASVAWLAAEGLRVLPTWNGGGQPRTTGISPEDARFTFPLWNQPLSLATVARLLWSVSSDGPDQWRRRGITTLLQCRRGLGGSKYKPVLLPPTPLW